MIKKFIPVLRELFKQGGYLEEKNSVETGGCFLIGFNGKLFKVEKDFQVGESIDRFNVVGCGNELALGALYILENLKEISVKKKVKKSLKCAAYHSCGVKGPFNILKLKY